MGNYRISRNIEASLIQYIEEELVTANLTNVSVEKTFARVYDINLPSICVRIEDTEHNSAEIGDTTTYRIPTVLIDIFATSDGNRLDLKDFLVSVLKKGFNYYEYTIANGQIQTKTQNGRVSVITIDDTIVNLNTDKNSLDVHDRYRHLLGLTLSTGKVEN
jgi:hypothetical protein